MAKAKITIIGLGVTGASMGLALQRDEADFEVMGHDKNQDAVAEARKFGAVNRTDWNLHSACENADLIITAVPLLELDELFGQIAEDLKPGCMVLGVVSLMEPAIAVAEKHIPEHAHFVAGHPVLTGVGGALTNRSDLVPGRHLLPGVQRQHRPECDPACLGLHRPHWRHAALRRPGRARRHHGRGGAVARVVAAALMRLSGTSAGWREACRLAGRQFALSTELGGSAAQLYSALRANREKVLVRLRQMHEELGEWIDLLENVPDEGETDALLTTLEDVEWERNDWAIHAELKDWDESQPTLEKKQKKEESGMFRQMFLGNMFGGPRRPPGSR